MDRGRLMLLTLALLPAVMESSPTITMGGQIILAVLAFMTAQLELGRRESRRASRAAAEAAERAKPTGNGWAAETTAQLDRIAAALGRLDRRLDNLDDRAPRRRRR